MIAPAPPPKQAGSTLIELLVVLAITGVALAAAALYLEAAEAPLQTAGAEVEAMFRQARLAALSTTSAVRVRPSAADRLVAESAADCASGVWTEERDLGLELPAPVTLDDTAWSLCFDSRGVSTANLVVTMRHPDTGTLDVEVLLGGAARVLP